MTREEITKAIEAFCYGIERGPGPTLKEMERLLDVANFALKLEQENRELREVRNKLLEALAWTTGRLLKNPYESEIRERVTRIRERFGLGGE